MITTRKKDFPKEDALNEIPVYRKHAGEFKVRQKVLYRKIIRKRLHTSVWQLVLPEKYRLEALKGCHDQVGHPAFKRTMGLLLDR